RGSYDFVSGKNESLGNENRLPFELVGQPAKSAQGHTTPKLRYTTDSRLSKSTYAQLLLPPFRALALWTLSALSDWIERHMTNLSDQLPAADQPPNLVVSCTRVP